MALVIYIVSCTIYIDTKKREIRSSSPKLCHYYCFEINEGERLLINVGGSALKDTFG